MWIGDRRLTKHTGFGTSPHAELDAVFHYSGNRDNGLRWPLRSARDDRPEALAVRDSR